MKKFFVLILIAAIFCSVLALVACEDNSDSTNETDKGKNVTYTLVAPDGAPALALANLSGNYSSEKTYTVTKKVVSSTNISTEALKSDLAIVPANLASKMYNEGNDIKLLAVVTNGNLFVTSNMESQADSLDDLVGKIVYSIGQNSVPDVIFKSLLKKNNIEYIIAGAGDVTATQNKVTISYGADATDVIAKMALAKAQGELVYGVYAEPAVTNSVANKGFFEVFDLQTLWAEETQSQYDGYAQAVLIAKSSVCQDKEFISALLKDFQANSQSVAQNPSKAVENIKAVYAQTSLNANTMTSAVVERCNINTLAMPENQAYYESMLNAVLEITPAIVGNKLPDDNFYYAG